MMPIGRSRVTNANININIVPIVLVTHTADIIVNFARVLVYFPLATKLMIISLYTVGTSSYLYVFISILTKVSILL